jgi:hypothetical protein
MDTVEASEAPQSLGWSRYIAAPYLRLAESTQNPTTTGHDDAGKEASRKEQQEQKSSGHQVKSRGYQGQASSLAGLW